jgi:5-methylcytosine-specific restriction endonuclease McrA
MSRKEFPTKTRKEALKRSGNTCEAVGDWYGLPAGERCRNDLSYGVQYDHLILDANSKDNSLENCRAVCPKCHGWKTANRDTPLAAKTVRQGSMGKRTKVKAPIAGRGFPAPDKPAKAGKTPLPPRRMFAPAGALWTQPRWEEHDDRTD